MFYDLIFVCLSVCLLIDNTNFKRSSSIKRLCIFGLYGAMYINLVLLLLLRQDLQ